MMPVKIYLLSTVVAPSFQSATLHIVELTPDEFLDELAKVDVNLCGHPITDATLRAVCPTLPPAEKKFWNGNGVALAARPKGGARGSGSNNIWVSFNDLEFCMIEWTPRARTEE